MPTNRFHHLIAVGLLVTVGLFLVLTAQVGLTAAATDTSDASTSGALQGNVRIHLQGSLSGPQFAAVARGRFTASGAISDRGRFVDKFEGIHPPGEPHVRTVLGANGTLRIKVDRTGQWRVTQGTKAYAGLRGRGTEQGRYAFTGRVTRP
jgi:hypothetical protein